MEEYKEKFPPSLLSIEVCEYIVVLNPSTILINVIKTDRPQNLKITTNSTYTRPNAPVQHIKLEIRMKRRVKKIYKKSAISSNRLSIDTGVCTLEV